MTPIPCIMHDGTGPERCGQSRTPSASSKQDDLVPAAPLVLLAVFAKGG